MLKFILKHWPWLQIIDRPGVREQYLHRWMLFPKNTWFNVYLHKFYAPDWSADIHDHPYSSLGVVLKGAYLEEYMDDPGVGDTTWRLQHPGRWQYRDASMAHAIRRIIDGPVWTVFIRFYSGDRRWGFWTRHRRTSGVDLWTWTDSEQYLQQHGD